MFIMSLAAADLTVGAIVMPISSVYALTGKPVSLLTPPVGDVKFFSHEQLVFLTPFLTLLTSE
jgi:hypothetical protein